MPVLQDIHDWKQIKISECSSILCKLKIPTVLFAYSFFWDFFFSIRILYFPVKLYFRISQVDVYDKD